MNGIFNRVFICVKNIKCLMLHEWEPIEQEGFLFRSPSGVAEFCDLLGLYNQLFNQNISPLTRMILRLFMKKTCFCCIYDNRVIGYILFLYNLEDRWCDIHLTNIGVAPEFRGKGVAKKLLAESVIHFKGVRRIHSITSKILEKNASSLALHKSVGFVEYRTVTENECKTKKMKLIL